MPITTKRCGANPGSSAATEAVPDVRVPLLDLRAQFAPIRQDVLTAITKVCDDQRFIMGPEVEGF